jgi:hypothetical protein
MNRRDLGVTMAAVLISLIGIATDPRPLAASACNEWYSCNEYCPLESECPSISGCELVGFICENGTHGCGWDQDDQDVAMICTYQ